MRQPASREERNICKLARNNTEAISQRNTSCDLFGYNRTLLCCAVPSSVVMPICCVKGCTNRFVKDGPVKFFRFPVEPERRGAWLRSVSRDEWQPTCWSGVCGEHFIQGQPDGDPESPDYVPSLKMSVDENLKPWCAVGLTSPTSSSRHMKKMEGGCGDVVVGAHSDDSNPQTSGPVVGAEEALDSESRSPLTLLCSTTMTTRKRRPDDPGTLRTEINSLKMKIRALEDLNQRTRFGENFLRGDDYRTSYLTGIPTYTAFCWLLSVCHSVLPKSRFLSPGDTLIMILSKLKLELPSDELADRYNIAEARAEQIVNLAVPLLTNKVQCLSGDKYVAKLPEEFKQGVFRVILLLTVKNA